MARRYFRERCVVAKRYLVTGGTGFIGSALVRRLVAAGHRVRVLDNNFRERRASLACPETGGIGGSRHPRRGKIRAAATGMDSVLHLAYISGTDTSIRCPSWCSMSPSAACLTS